jgi:hypothetical protein
MSGQLDHLLVDMAEAKHMLPDFNKAMRGLYNEIRDGYASRYEPFPARFYAADLSQTGGGNPLIAPEKKASNSLLVHFDSGTQYKSTLRYSAPQGQVLASGWKNGHKRQAQTGLIILHPGDKLIVSMKGSTNTQSLSYQDEWR